MELGLRTGSTDNDHRLVGWPTRIERNPDHFEPVVERRRV